MDVVYHGSPDRFERVEPKRNRRLNKNDEIIWDRKSFHATPHKWIALAYTRSGKENHSTGVDLYELKKIVHVWGPTNLSDALRELYGKGGYLYEFDAREFSHEEGLGNLERFTDKSLTPTAVTRIDDPVAAMKELGVEFKFELFRKSRQYRRMLGLPKALDKV